MFTKLFADQAIAWLLTYLLHSTFLLGLAWLVSKPIGRWSVAAEEAVWKLALVGALFTASLQLAAGWEPAAGRWELGAATKVERSFAQPQAKAPMPESVQPLSVSPSVPLSVAVRPAAAPLARVLPSLPALALGVWAVIAGLLLAAYGRSHLRLHSRLRNRPRVVGGTLLSRLRLLSAETELGGEVRLSCSSRVPVPVALGLRRSEICVPPRALAGLSDEQQEGMLAHELAHLVRRDPLWLVVSHLMACAFFFQPLNWVARRRLREISEMLSDEWAVSRTGRPLSLAGCLAEVAAWSARGRDLPVPVMADRPSHLAQRIRRLLDEGRRPESPARRIWMGAAMVVLLLAVVAAAPAVSAARQEAPAQPAQATAAPPAAAEAAEIAEDPEPPEAAEPKEHAVAEQRVEKHAAAQEEADRDADQADQEVENDNDYDVNLDFDADEIAERATAAATAALDAVDGQLERLSEMRPLSDADREKLEREIERTNQEIEGKLRPRMEQLSRELSEKISREMPTPEMRKVEEQMRALAEQMRPSGEEMERMRAQMDAEMKKLRADGEMNREEREKIVAEARRMAREMRPTAEQRKAMEDLRRQHQELSRQFMGEHREEIEKATREMREEIQQEMRAVREEVRRSMEQQRKLMQEERRERERRRQEMRKDRERDHKREHGHGEAKPPKAPDSGGD